MVRIKKQQFKKMRTLKVGKNFKRNIRLQRSGTLKQENIIYQKFFQKANRLKSIQKQKERHLTNLTAEKDNDEKMILDNEKQLKIIKQQNKEYKFLIDQLRKLLRK